MLNLDNKEYDLNTLFSFEVLKEILLKLARSQDKIENDINNMKQNISKKDKIILKLQKAVFNQSDGNEEDDEDDFNNNEIDDNENKIKEKEYENKEQKEINLMVHQENEKVKNINDGDVQKKESNNDEDNKNEKERIEINSNEKTISDKSKINDSNFNQIPQKGKNVSGVSGISSELISKMSKQIKELIVKINIVDNKLKSEAKNIKNIESRFNNHELDNESQFKLVNDRINNLLQKNQEYDKEIEDLKVKTTELDVFSMFKDSGDGTIDATKVMVKALEEKIFKKFELVDARYKKDALDNLKMKTNVENITPKLEQFHRELSRISDINKQQKEDLDTYKKENEEQNLDNFSNINNDFNQKLLELKEQMEKNLKNKLLLLETQLKNMKKDSKDNDNNAFDLLKLSLGNNGLDSEVAQTLEKKINDLRKKTNDLENTLKLNNNNQDTDLLKKELKDLKLLIDKKISKDDLKELYNFHLSDVDELNDIKDREAIINDELKKTIKDVQNIQQRLESINGNLSLLQNSPTNGNMKIVDFSKYIDNQKLTEALKPFFKEFEKIFKEIDSFRRDLGEIENQNKQNIKNAISKLEEDFNNKLIELKDFVKKRYLEKMEFTKTIKSLEVQIKALGNESKKVDADSWLLAKRPLKCFNCASCEANIKDDNYNTADYLPWKKYPRGEKIHRMGQGFSHMLQMMTSEFVKSIEKSEFPIEYDMSSKNNNTSYNASNFANDKANMTGFVINSKEQTQEDGFQNLKKNNKIKLPKVKQYSKPKIRKFEETLPISDDDFIEKNNEDNNEKASKSNSPKIVKITKKNRIRIGEEKSNNNMLGNLMTLQGGFRQRDSRNFGLGRNFNTTKNEKNEQGTITVSSKN
jgi:hypothetical protein